MTPLERDHERGLNGALAAEIRAELAVQDRKQTWLAQATDIDRLTLRRYLKAERALNTALTEAIAEALGVDPGELMARAVSRRNRYPELYGPQVATSGHAGVDDGEPLSEEDQAEVDAAVARVDAAVRSTRPARTREEMQRMPKTAARKNERDERKRSQR